MARTFTIKGRIEAEDAASATVDKAEQSFASLGSTVAGLSPVALSAGAAFTALAGFLKASLSAANEQEDALNALNSALKLSGPAAEAQASALAKQADQLQRTTRFSDEAVNSAQALLATYRVQADLLPLATQATADLAARLGIDLQTAASQVGAAFNGVTRGLEKVVPGLLSVSDAGFDGAKNIQLLADTMAGGAVEAAHTLSGEVDILANRYGELQEAVGKNESAFIKQIGVIKLASTVLDELIRIATTGGASYSQFADVVSGSSSSVDQLTRSITTLAQIQDRSTRIISEQATAQSRASQIAKELGLTLEADVIQKQEREAELLRELAGLEEQGANVRLATVKSTKDLGVATDQLSDGYETLGTSVDVTNDALRLVPGLFQNIRAEANAATNAVLFTARAFDELRRAGQGSQAIESAVQGGGKLINFGTMIQFPDGSVRLVDATLRSNQGGGQFVNLDGTPRKF